MRELVPAAAAAAADRLAAIVAEGSDEVLDPDAAALAATMRIMARKCVDVLDHKALAVKQARARG